MSQFDCYGPLTFIPQGTESPQGKFYLTCTSTEENVSDHDCVCSTGRDFNVTTSISVQAASNTCPDVTSNDVSNPCMITWKGEYSDAIDVLPGSCRNVLASPSCKTKCQWQTDNKVICKNTIMCRASPDHGTSHAGNVCSSVRRDVVSTTKSAITGTEKGETGITVIALGVVTGLAIIALVITLVLVFLRRHRKRRTPTTNDYMDMNVGEVGNTTYESSVGLPNQYESLENECSNPNDRKSGLYMDLDDPTIGQSDQSTEQNHGTETMDNIYNSIDECEPAGDQGYVQAIDPAPRGSSGTASPVNVTATSANSSLEKQEEEKSKESAKNLTENLNPTEDYFVLDKDESRVTSDLIDNHTDSAIVNGNKADNYFILEEQANEQNPESVSSENYFLLEKEKETNTNEDTAIGDTYNTLNNDVTTEHTDDYSHARVVGGSQENIGDGPVTENSDDYDKLFHQPNNNVLRDSDNDYDHMASDDLLTFL